MYIHLAVSNGTIIAHNLFFNGVDNLTQPAVSCSCSVLCRRMVATLGFLKTLWPTTKCFIRRLAFVWSTAKEKVESFANAFTYTVTSCL